MHQAFEQPDNIDPFVGRPPDPTIVKVVAIHVDGGGFSHAHVPSGMKKPPFGGFFVPGRLAN
jgi:hypothetical protein